MIRLIHPYVVLPTIPIQECKIKMSTYQFELFAFFEFNGKISTYPTFIGYIPMITDDGYFIVSGRELIVRNYEEHKYHVPLHFEENVIKVYSEGSTVTLKNSTDIKVGMVNTTIHTIATVIGEDLGPVFEGGICDLDGLRQQVGEDLMAWVTKEVCPWMSPRQALSFLVLCAKRGTEPQLDDKNAFQHKRIRTPGEIVSRLVRRRLSVQWREFSKKEWNTMAECMSMFNCHSFTKFIRSVFSTGTFERNMTGVTQTLDRTCNNLMGQLGRICLPLSDENTDLTPRMVHGTEWGYKCPFETPEGARIGLVTNLAFTAQISVPGNPFEWYNLLAPFCDTTSSRNPKCRLDGRIIGSLLYPPTTLLHLKRLWPFPAIRIHENGSVDVDITGGRPLRPIYIAEPIRHWTVAKPGNKTLIIYDGPIQQINHVSHVFGATVWETPGKIHLLPNYVQWVDPGENNLLDIGVTSWECNPSFIFGRAALRTPFLNHNAAPRIKFASHTAHQAIGSYRNDLFTEQHWLWYNQRPLLDTLASRIHPEHTGMNVLVFVMTHLFNEEDGVVINKSFIDRGGFRIMHQTVVTVITTEEIQWTIDIGKLIQKGDVVVRVASQNYVSDGAGRIQSVIMTVDDNDRFVVRVIVVEMRCPQVGDKLMSRHGQKHIISAVYSNENMPFTSEGLAADLIISPLAFPSRMTLSQLLESYESTRGGKVDPTPFCHIVDETYHNQAVYDGEKGQMIPNVQTGFVYYQRSVHQVNDKFRATGVAVRDPITRQPLNSSNGGGLRIGADESLRLIEHGATSLLQELYTRSDSMDMFFCQQCKLTTQQLRCCNEFTKSFAMPFAMWVILEKLKVVGIDWNYIGHLT